MFSLNEFVVSHEFESEEKNEKLLPTQCINQDIVAIMYGKFIVKDRTEIHVFSLILPRRIWSL